MARYTFPGIFPFCPWRYEDAPEGSLGRFPFGVSLDTAMRWYWRVKTWHAHWVIPVPEEPPEVFDDTAYQWNALGENVPRIETDGIFDTWTGFRMEPDAGMTDTIWRDSGPDQPRALYQVIGGEVIIYPRIEWLVQDLTFDGHSTSHVGPEGSLVITVVEEFGFLP